MSITLSFGYSSLKDSTNNLILNSTVSYAKATKRCDDPIIAKL